MLDLPAVELVGFVRGLLPRLSVLVDHVKPHGALTSCSVMGAAVATRERPDPDWTVGVRVAKIAEGVFVVEDVLRLRDAPGVVERTVRNTAELDGRDTTVDIR